MRIGAANVLNSTASEPAEDKAHHRAGDNKPLYLGHPQFEGFDVIQTVKGG